jgi:hypothetical protein
MKGGQYDGVACGHETGRARAPTPGASGGPRPRSPRRAAPCPHAPRLRPADAIGSYWGNPKTRIFGELLIDCEEDRTLRAVLVGMLREMERR